MNAFTDASEDRVLYRDGDAVRTLRGRVVEAGPTWVILARRDGKHWLKADTVLRIDMAGRDGGTEKEYVGDLRVVAWPDF